MSVERLIQQLLGTEISRRSLGKGALVLALTPKESLRKAIGVLSQNSEPISARIPEPPRLPTPQERLIQFQEEFEEKIKPAFLENYQEISQLRENGILGNLEMLEMYYPIYATAETRFDVPWFLLWLIHDAESTISQDIFAFAKSRHYGAMQRDITIYSQSEVEMTAKGFAYLVELPQNQPDDWKEILWAAAKLDRDAQKALKIYPWKDRNWTLEDALDSYSELEESRKRKVRFRVLKEIFN